MSHLHFLCSLNVHFFFNIVKDSFKGLLFVDLYVFLSCDFDMWSMNTKFQFFSFDVSSVNIF